MPHKAMKRILKILAIGVVVATFAYCAVAKVDKGATNQTAIEALKGRVALKGATPEKDSTQYELIIFDQGFEFWLNSHAHSKHLYSNEYLQNINNQYVIEWNRLYAVGDPRVLSYLDYNYFTNYGLEFNYQLFMYFRYFEETNKVKLLPYRSSR